MTVNLIDTESRWTERQLPRADRASVTLSAWTSDEELAAVAADRAHVYGNEFDLDTVLRLARADLRRAAMAQAVAAGNQVLIQSVLDAGVDELVTASTTDADLDVLVTAAEAGYGKPIPGLRRELELLRGAEREDATA